jgi:oligopeptide/dipeptide ABC transporter ATP-binding protein
VSVAAPPTIMSTTAVSKVFGHGPSSTIAVQPADVEIREGRSVGVAGESGSGKSTLLRLLLGLEPPTSGTVAFGGTPLTDLRGADRHRYRRAVQAVFQDPGGSLNPRQRIWRSITEPAAVADRLDKSARRRLAGELLARVELPPAFVDRLPHQLSGGERQRVAIARALSSSPRLVLLDEPVTALDVSVRGAIINLLAERLGDVTYAVVSHDLTVIAHLTDELLIMYQGYIVERGPTDTILDDPLHPYTRALVAAAADPLSEGGADDDRPAPAGACPYLHRCPHAMPACAAMPDPVGTEHEVRCHLYGPEQPAIGDVAPTPPSVNVTGAHP